MSARIGIVVFPGTNCELDVAWVIEELGGEAQLLWHGDRSVRDVDAVVVPGGFAHGDYLRTGAIARFSPVMTAVSAERLVSTRSAAGSHRNVSPAFFWSAPGRSPASVSTWKPLQIPSTGPPAAAKSATAPIAGAKRAIAPARR